MLRHVFTWLCVLAVASALYEDQLGSFDWYKPHIGVLKDAAFHPSKPRVCLSTQQDTIGCLNLRDGSIAWRKLLGPVDAIANIDSAQQLFLAVSEHGTVLQAFEQTEGLLKWEHRTSGPVVPAHPATLFVNSTAPGYYQVVLLSHQVLQVINANDGELVHRKQVPEITGENVLMFQAGSQVAAVALTSRAQAATVVTLAGAEVQTRSLESSMPLSITAAAGAAGLAVVSQSGQQLCLAAVTGGQLTERFSCSDLSDWVNLEQPVALSLVATSTGFIVTGRSTVGNFAAVANVGSDGQLQFTKVFKEVSAVSASVESDQGQLVAMLGSTAAGVVKVQVASTLTGDVVLEDTVSKTLSDKLVADSVLPQLSKVILGTYKKKDHTDGFRFLFTWSDGQMALAQQGQAVWVTDESLASVIDSVFIDLPASKHDAELLDAPKVDFSTRIRTELLGAKIQLKLNTPAEAAEYQDLRAQLSDKNRAVRDVNGFRKLIVVLTATGKLLALHNGDGRVIWSHYFGPGGPRQLLAWRTFHDISHAPQVAVLHAGAERHVSILNGHTGSEIEKVQLSSNWDEVVKLHSTLHDGTADQHVYLLVSYNAGTPTLTLLPDNRDSRAYVAYQYRSLYFWLFDRASNTFTGHGMDSKGAAAATADSATLPTTQVWQLTLPETVLATQLRDPAEAVQTSVKVLGDRSMKYKYLNPNTIFVATGVPDGQDVEGDDEQFFSLTAILLDTVTGRILHRQVHPGARGPVSAVVTENLVVYQFWDAVLARFQVCSMEMYDATPREFNVLDYLFNPNSTQPQSSFVDTPLQVLSQCFFMQAKTKVMSVTQTANGITSKMLLFATHTDQVYALDRRFLDPRRPKKQKLSPEETEERLIPYQDTLPVTPVGFYTYDKQVLGLNTLVVEPSRLESTCLMFASGVDLFYTRISPAKAFDSLEDDFNYALLVVMLIALSIGCGAMWYITKQAGLKQKWV